MATKMMDVGLDADGDLDVLNGDFSMVESTVEHQKSLILDAPGDYKQNPTVGVNAFGYQDDDSGGTGYNDLINAISSQFQQDGMLVSGVSLRADGIVEADAFYK